MATQPKGSQEIVEWTTARTCLSFVVTTAYARQESEHFNNKWVPLTLQPITSCSRPRWLRHVAASLSVTWLADLLSVSLCPSPVSEMRWMWQITFYYCCWGSRREGKTKAKAEKDWLHWGRLVKREAGKGKYDWKCWWDMAFRINLFYTGCLDIRGVVIQLKPTLIE